VVVARRAGRGRRTAVSRWRPAPLPPVAPGGLRRGQKGVRRARLRPSPWLVPAQVEGARPGQARLRDDGPRDDLLPRQGRPHGHAETQMRRNAAIPVNGCLPGDDRGRSTRGVVRDWNGVAGWGVIDSSQTPGGCWATTPLSRPPRTGSVPVRTSPPPPSGSSRTGTTTALDVPDPGARTRVSGRDHGVQRPQRRLHQQPHPHPHPRADVPVMSTSKRSPTRRVGPLRAARPQTTPAE